MREVPEKRDNTSAVQRMQCPIQKMKKGVEIRRRIGVVEANDTAQAERRKARVLSKKFGEEMMHEKPSIFNKKL